MTDGEALEDKQDVRIESMLRRIVGEQSKGLEENYPDDQIPSVVKERQATPVKGGNTEFDEHESERYHIMQSNSLEKKT
jgi:hypothetical protein